MGTVWVYCKRHQEVAALDHEYVFGRSPRQRLKDAMAGDEMCYGRYRESVTTFASRHTCCALEQWSYWLEPKKMPPFINVTYPGGRSEEYKRGWRCFGSYFVWGYWEGGQYTLYAGKAKRPVTRGKMPRTTRKKAASFATPPVPAMSCAAMFKRTAPEPTQYYSGCWY